MSFRPLKAFKALSPLKAQVRPLSAVIRSLFSAGEQGIWLDPSDLDASKLAWRRNLLLRSDDFVASPWLNEGTAPSLTANAGLAPDGVMRATRITFSGADSRRSQNGWIPLPNTTYTLSVWAKSAVPGVQHRFTPSFYDGVASYMPAHVYVGDAWTRVAVSYTTGETVGGGSLKIRSAYAGDILICDAMLNVGATADDYQRITDFSTEFLAAFPNHTLFQDSAGTIPVTKPGEPVGKILDKSGRGNHATQSTSTARPIFRQTDGKSSLEFDGIDDCLVTQAINFTGTDKLTVWAAVRKASDAAVGIVAELSANTNSNNGAFFLAAPITAAGPNYSISSKGTVATSQSVTGFAAPTTNVVSGSSDISGDSLKVRVNSGAWSVNTSDQGTGNFGNYPLYIGRRGGTTLPFSGHLYGLLIRGSVSGDAQLRSAERFLAQRSGVTL